MDLFFGRGNFCGGKSKGRGVGKGCRGIDGRGVESSHVKSAFETRGLLDWIDGDSHIWKEEVLRRRKGGLGMGWRRRCRLIGLDWIDNEDHDGITHSLTYPLTSYIL